MVSTTATRISPGQPQTGILRRPDWGRACGTASVSVLIPSLNEEENLPHVLACLPKWIDEVILIDGGSVDRTVEVAKQHLPSIRIVRQEGLGKGNAFIEGFAHCKSDLVIALDADGSMDPREMDYMVALLESGFDYVKGSRMITGGGSSDLTLLRRFGNFGFRTLANTLFGSRYSDLCYGYFGFRRGTIDTLNLRASGFEIETEIAIKAHRAQFQIAEAPSCESPRLNGESNLRTYRDGLRILRVLLVERFRSTAVTCDLTARQNGHHPESENPVSNDQTGSVAGSPSLDSNVTRSRTRTLISAHSKWAVPTTLFAFGASAILVVSGWI